MSIFHLTSGLADNTSDITLPLLCEYIHLETSVFLSAGHLLKIYSLRRNILPVVKILIVPRTDSPLLVKSLAFSICQLKP